MPSQLRPSSVFVLVPGAERHLHAVSGRFLDRSGAASTFARLREDFGKCG